MDMNNHFCHGCGITFYSELPPADQSDAHQSQPQCPRCGSEFVELMEDGDSRDAEYEVIDAEDPDIPDISGSQSQIPPLDINAVLQGLFGAPFSVPTNRGQQQSSAQPQENNNGSSGGNNRSQSTGRQNNQNQQQQRQQQPYTRTFRFGPNQTSSFSFSYGPGGVGGGMFSGSEGPQQQEEVQNINDLFQQFFQQALGAQGGLFNQDQVRHMMGMVGNPGDYAWGANGMDDVITRLMEQFGGAHNKNKPASDDDIAKLKRSKYESRSSDDRQESDECAICKDNFMDGDKLCSLPQCKHYFHEQCIVQWLKTSDTCPIDRRHLSDQPTASSPSQQSSNSTTGQQDNDTSSHEQQSSQTG
ncbi:hypothetical protein MP228_002922 [Amoeboaphelidium protococcarum]|nr:hypothetical protein MP228_002922 [Amoeboaphelidium protococcarum]